VQNLFVAKDPAHNKVWFNNTPYMASNNVVTLWLNVTRAPLTDPKVRQAVSYAIDRQQLAAQGETGYELPATSSSGLLLPVDQSLLQSQYANDLPASGDTAKVASILTSAGYTKVNGKWTKNGKTIKFSIEDPIPFSDFWLDVQLVTAQLNKLGFDVKAQGIGNPTNWFTDQATGNFDAMIRWSNNGPTPYYYFYNWMDNATSAPLGKTAANNFGRFSNPQAQSALTQYVSSTDQATQKEALNTDFPGSVEKVFGPKPEAGMVYEGDFVAGVAKDQFGKKIGEDANFFPFPAVDGGKAPVVSGGDAAVVLKDGKNQKAAMQFLEYLATPEASAVWAKAGGFLSPNKKLDLASYGDDVTRETAKSLVGAGDSVRFDMSDQAPAAFGGTKGAGEWKLLQDFLRDPSDPKGTAAKLETAAAKAYQG